MKFTRLSPNGVVKIELEPIRDDRGALSVVFRANAFKAEGLPEAFVHAYKSVSRRGVIRGLHFQYSPPLEKLMRVSRGKGMLVVADIRKKSEMLGKWYAEELSAYADVEVFVPAGFAIGFCALEDDTQLECFCTGPYNGDGEGSIAWNDLTLNIAWPVQEPILSVRDSDAPALKDWLLRPESDLL